MRSDGDSHGAGLTDHGDADLAGVSDLRLQGAGDVGRERLQLAVGEDDTVLALAVVDGALLLAGDDDAHLAAGVHDVDAADRRRAAGDPLNLLDAGDVLGDALAARTGTGAGERVGGGDDESERCLHRLVVVVRADGVGDVLALAAAPRHLGAEDGVRALVVVGHGLANVVQEPAASRQRRIDAELFGEHAGDGGDLDGVLELILRVAQAELEPPDEVQDLGMDVPEIELSRGLAAGLGGGDGYRYWH